MRAWFLLALGACSPDIATGAYLCGAEELCPSGQVCDGATAACVVPAVATTFACDPADEVDEPDQTVGQAHTINTLACVSTPVQIDACLASGDADDWYAITIANGCTTVHLDVRIDSALGFEPVTVELRDATGATILATAATGCPNVEPAETSGERAFCITSQAVAAAGMYTLHVKPAGGLDCAGTCAFNTYRMTLNTSF